MRFKSIAVVIATAMLLAGCSSKSTDAKSVDNTAAVKSAITNACYELNKDHLGTLPLIDLNVAEAFNKIAVLDVKYTDIAKEAYVSAVIAEGFALNVSNVQMQADRFKTIANVMQFCDAHK